MKLGQVRQRRRQRGQVVVETALIMPFFVFFILGLLQLGLMHQARVLAKYAAYKAVRVGAIHNAKMSAMKRAALAVVLPMTGRRTTPESFYRATPESFGTSWNDAKNKNESGWGADQLIEVMICEPYGSVTGDFDDPTSPMAVMGSGGVGGSDSSASDGPEEGDDGSSSGNKSPDANWHQFNAGRLMVQVTFNHQMVIPFANSVLWHIVAGQERAETMRTLRLTPGVTVVSSHAARTIRNTASLAQQNIYIMPIRASWSMRMQSNFLPGGDFRLPAQNNCRVSWK